MFKNILITGAYGQLGLEIQNILSRRGIGYFATDLTNLDITNVQAVHKFINTFQPDAIINCAAYTNVDKAETEKDTCFEVNAVGTYTLAVMAVLDDIPMMHFSTDYVFSGLEQGVPYTIYDNPSPLNVYGQSKIVSEAFMKNVSKRYIVRLSSVFGRSKINFINKILASCQKQEEVKVVSDQTALVSYAPDIAPILIDLLFSGQYGLYQLGNTGAVSRYEWAKYAVEVAGLPNKVVPIDSSNLSLPAKRPGYSVMDISDIVRVTGRTPPSWQNATERFVSNLEVSHGQSQSLHQESER